uniref:T-lymphocyte surface antigen Ly-9-like n=1 Tax=Scatophagus argus TaxID=75038 RepID=UPI001ED839E2|nr:T-lymphocyte surface antigen Ly-9-like [Scatophagus argus]
MRGLTMLVLLNCWIIAGATAEGPPVLHYQLKNSTFCLQAGKSHHSKSLDDILWSFNKKAVVRNKQVGPSFKDKVTYNSSSLSLCVNNLTETDSGSYDVLLLDDSGMTSTEFHILKVQETVPRPVIRTSIMHTNLSAGLCNITVNCSVQNDWTWTLCDEDSCWTSQRSHTQVNISIDIKNRSIVCTGNNHVSASKVSESIDPMCFNGSAKVKVISAPLFVIGVVVATCVTLWAAIGLVAINRSLSRRKNCHLAEAPPVQSTQPAGTYREPRFSTASSEAEVSYENVEPSRPSEELDSKQSQGVDTVYSFLQMPNATASASRGKHANAHTNIREASTSPSSSQPVDEQHARADTVYSVLEKTQNAVDR